MLGTSSIPCPRLRLVRSPPSSYLHHHTRVCMYMCRHIESKPPKQTWHIRGAFHRRYTSYYSTAAPTSLLHCHSSALAVVDCRLSSLRRSRWVRRRDCRLTWGSFERTLLLTTAANGRLLTLRCHAWFSAVLCPFSSCTPWLRGRGGRGLLPYPGGYGWDGWLRPWGASDDRWMPVTPL